jgi:pSer/pThr/pTyr-binding forkhead associated (FHA) protein
MADQTLHGIKREFYDRDVGISFIVHEGLIRIHTCLTCTDQLSVPVSISTNSQWMVGRSNRSDIIVQNSTISRQHAILGYDVHLGGFYIMDCISHNGTFLNQIRLNPLQRYVLKDRDMLGLHGQTIYINIIHKDLEPQR